MRAREDMFGDYEPHEVPQALPATFWVYWDICGEFMDITDDPKQGEAWLASMAGYSARYERLAVSQGWKP